MAAIPPAGTKDAAGKAFPQDRKLRERASAGTKMTMAN
jgi:hypothetical protein